MSCIEDLCRYASDPEQTVVYLVIFERQLLIIGQLLYRTAPAGSRHGTPCRDPVRGCLIHRQHPGIGHILFYFDDLCRDHIFREGILDEYREPFGLGYTGSI